MKETNTGPFQALSQAFLLMAMACLIALILPWCELLLGLCLLFGVLLPGAIVAGTGFAGCFSRRPGV